MGIEIQLFGFVLNMIGWTFLLSWLLLWMRGRPGDRPRLCLAVIFFIGWLHFVERIVAFYYGPVVEPEVLSVSYVCGGVLGITTLYLYPIMVINPGWITWKRGVWLVVPWLLVGLLLPLLPLEFRPLSSFGDMTKHIGEFNVWLRLLLTLVIPVYTFLLFYIPYNWMKSSITQRWIYYYTFWGMAISFCYMLFILTGWMTAICIHHTLCLLFCIMATYQELYIRIAVSVEPADEEILPPSPSLQAEEAEEAENAAEAEVMEVTEVTEVTGTATSVAEPEESTCPPPLWNELTRLMEQEELWRNPDLSLEKLAERLGTNRTTLTQVIRRESNSGYKEFVNRFRMEEFLKNINTKTLPNIQEEFFKVGFRSKATALRNFKEYTGCTPTDYLRKMADEN